MKRRYAVIVMAALVLAGRPAFGQDSPGSNAPVNVRGQILLPFGDLPNSPIRFELQDSTGMMHDLRFTDSNGRFVLEQLKFGSNYIIIVESDDRNWGSTRYEFMAGMSADPRFYLKPLAPKRSSKPATISANSAYVPAPKIAELHDTAMKAYREGKSAEAEALLRQATTADPKYAIAFNDLGVILMRARRFAEAEPILRKGLEADPKSVTLLVNLGSALLHAGKFLEAIRPLREALRLKPDQADAHLQLGAALVETDQLVEGELELMVALNAKGPNDSGVQLYLGKLYASRGEYAKAIQAFNSYLRLAPPDSPNIPAIRAAVLKMQDEMAKNAGK
jgi:Flp pilus assembly protein TadD